MLPLFATRNLKIIEAKAAASNRTPNAGAAFDRIAFIRYAKIGERNSEPEHLVKSGKDSSLTHKGRKMESSKVTAKGQITLPCSIRRRMGISRGDTMGFALTRQGILIKPIHLIDKTRTHEWRKKLNQALHETKSEQGAFYEDTKSFLKALEKT